MTAERDATRKIGTPIGIDNVVACATVPERTPRRTAALVRRRSPPPAAQNSPSTEPAPFPARASYAISTRATPRASGLSGAPRRAKLCTGRYSAAVLCRGLIVSAGRPRQTEVLAQRLALVFGGTARAAADSGTTRLQKSSCAPGYRAASRRSRQGLAVNHSSI
jgi:hypothetical protein